MIADKNMYKVRFEWHYKSTLHNISEWCKKNCSGTWHYQYTSTVFWFEKSEDAMMLKLALPSLYIKERL